MPALVLVLGLWSVGVIAAPAVDPGAARAAQAQALAAFEAGRLAEAADLFSEAYAADPQPAFLLNIALVEQQRAGRCRAALDAVARFERACPACGIEAQGQGTRARIEAACTGRLTVRCDAPGAVVWVDGVERGPAPVTVDLIEGPHAARVVAPDGRAVDQPVLIRQGVAAEVALALGRSPAAPEARPVADAIEAVAAAPIEEPSATPTGWWVLAGGVAGLATGLGFHLAAMDTINDAAALDPAAPGYAADYTALGESLELQSAGVWLGYGLGAALTGVGIWLLASDSAVGVVGAVTPDGGAWAALGLRF